MLQIIIVLMVEMAETQGAHWEGGSGRADQAFRENHRFMATDGADKKLKCHRLD